MPAFPTIVIEETRPKISRHAAVVHLVVRLAGEYVNIMKAFHSTCV
jgi:hypothetical protein